MFRRNRDRDDVTGLVERGMIISEMKASLTLSIMDSMRQRRLSIEDAARIADVEPATMRTLVERRELLWFSAQELIEILDAIDASGPRYGGRP